MLLAVNGTLMRELELNKNLVNVGAVFVRETKTAPIYRLWSIQGQYPAMLRDTDRGTSIDVELWEISPAGLVHIIQNEPAGLTLGWVTLENMENTLGVLGEPYITDGQQEITTYGGWRAFIQDPM